MCSLYLGKIGNSIKTYEIHAITNGMPFREFTTSQISDIGLYEGVLNERFKVLEGGRPIYCTAVNPDVFNRKEYNPHDDREGTVHIVAIDGNDKSIGCVLSTAVDIGEKDNGETIGLPLENRWKGNGYPEGASLDPIRESYTRLNHGSDTSMKPWQMAELYRHFKKSGNGKNDLIPRIGVYTGAYHLLVREARKNGKTPTFIWVFDAIPNYFHLYRLAGAAVLRDPTIESPPRYVSPGIGAIDQKSEGIFYKGGCISRNVRVPIPDMKDGELGFHEREVPFLDGIVDVKKLESAADVSPIEFSSIKYEGIDQTEIETLKMVFGVMGRRYFEENYGSNKEVTSLYNGLREKLVSHWDFNNIG